MGQPLILPKWKFFDAGGAVLAGGKLYSYAAGTTTPQATYTDATEATPNTNPLILDANGEGVIWLGTLSYKFVLKDSLDNVLWTADGVQTIPNGSVTTIKLADGSVTTAKLADDAVTTVKILDQNVTTAKLADSNVTTVKIADGAVTFAKLSASTAIAFVDTSGPRYGDGPSAFPVKSWAAPTTIANPASAPVGDGMGVAWSPNGKLLAVAQNNTDFCAVYERFGDELVKLSPGISSPPSETAKGLSWSPDSQYLIVAGTSKFHIFQKTGNAFAEVYNAFSDIQNATAWCPNGKYFATAQDSNPFVRIMKRSDVTKNHIVAFWAQNSAQVITNNVPTIVKYNVQVEDNIGSADTFGGSWAFDCYRTNGYTVSAFVRTGLFTGGGTLEFTLVKNGSVYSYMDVRILPASGTIAPAASGCVWLPLSTGPIGTQDVIQIQLRQISGGSTTLPVAQDSVFVSVVEDGGFDQLSTFAGVTSPSTLPTGNAKAVAWSPDGLFLAVGHATTPFVTIYQRTGDTFAKCTNPLSLPTGQVNGLSWSPDGLTLTCVHAVTPFITNYYRSSVSSTTFTKISVNPTALPASTGNACAYNSVGTKLAVAHDTSPFLTIYSVSGAGSAKTFTKDTDPTTLPTGNGKSVSWTPDSNYLSVGHVGSPYVTNYKTSGSYGSNAITYVNEVDLV